MCPVEAVCIKQSRWSKIRLVNAGGTTSSQNSASQLPAERLDEKQEADSPPQPVSKEAQQSEPSPASGIESGIAEVPEVDQTMNVLARVEHESQTRGQEGAETQPSNRFATAWERTRAI